jgi:hypothetical protein
MPSGRVAAAAALALILAAAASRPARADDAPPETPPSSAAPAASPAADLKKSGNEKMVDSDFVGALADYHAALALAPNDVALYYNIGRAEGLLGHHPAALAALEAFSARATPEQKAKIAKLSTLLAETREHVAYLTVACSVRNARVQLGAEVVGNAPLARVGVEAGAATITIDAEGYLDDVRNVTLDGAKELTLDCHLLPKSTSGTLVANATPTGARISVDGKFLGNTHVETPLHAGPHTERDGYEKSSMTVVVNAGDVKKLDIPLQTKPVPITARWWFWGGVAAVVVGGAVITTALLTERSADKGSIPPQQLSAPLRF